MQLSNIIMTNQRGVKHYIVISMLASLTQIGKGELVVNIVRIRNLGSIPVRIVKSYKEDILFSEAINRVTTLCELDDDIFDMLAEHCKNQ